MTALSLAQKMAALPQADRQTILEDLDPAAREKLLYDWNFWARPNQLEPPGDWRTWIILAGRGFGKTRSGAEWLRSKVENGVYRRTSIVGATASDVRDIMVEGESGILATSPPWNRPEYLVTKRRLVWPNGAVATCFSADEPERLRGHQHEAVWADELCAWRYPEAWTQLMLGLRLGTQPRTVVTTTPKPTRLLKTLIAADGTHVTKGSTYDNLDNLADAFTDEIVRVYEGTRFGRQELYAEILDDHPGALWSRSLLDATRSTDSGQMDVDGTPLRPKPAMKRIVVAIDPAMSLTSESSETGIVVAGLGTDDHGYVLDDISGKYRPEEWASKAITAYHRWEADRIVAEKNQGGDLVKANLSVVDDTVPVKLVRASKGKFTRAEPVAAVYEQHRAHHVGYFGELEEQMCEWEAGDPDSPDRLDALVWGMSELMVGRRGAGFVPMVDNPLAKTSYWRGI